MRKIYHLSTCSTCQRIISELNLNERHMEFQDIKSEAITPNQLEEMRDLAGDYESLFSRRAMKFRSMGLHQKELSEKDYKDFILKEYTFLKRPVIIVDDQIFIGNSKKEIEKAAAAIA